MPSVLTPFPDTDVHVKAVAAGIHPEVASVNHRTPARTSDAESMLFAKWTYELGRDHADARRISQMETLILNVRKRQQ